MADGLQGSGKVTELPDGAAMVDVVITLHPHRAIHAQLRAEVFFPAVLSGCNCGSDDRFFVVAEKFVV